VYQLDLFQRHIPPCGRQDKPFCKVEERSSAVGINTLQCIYCGSIVPTTVRSS
jgi:hypothetical protein